MRTRTATAHSDGLGGSDECAWFDPFMDLTLDYSDGTPRLVGYPAVTPGQPWFECNRGDLECAANVFPSTEKVLPRAA